MKQLALFDDNTQLPDKQNDVIFYQSDDGHISVRLMTRDGNVWLNQTHMAMLFDTSKQNVGIHVGNVLEENELDGNAVVKNFFTTANDGKTYNITFYSLDMILAVGFRVKNKRGTQFRQWANKNLKEFMVKGFVMDDHRLKNPDGRTDYFDELLERIRDIRASEIRFYQKVKELFTLATDYDPTDKVTQMFFAETQNKLLYAITGKTAAEIVVSRADPTHPNMALTQWKGNVVRKQDIFVAKNYLTEDELDSLNRLVTIFLEVAEFQVKGHNDINMQFWKSNVDGIITLNNKKLLRGLGSVSNKQMELHVENVYQKFDQHRKKQARIDADQHDINELIQLETIVKTRKEKRKKKP
jgi:hypothetical protein